MEQQACCLRPSACDRLPFRLLCVWQTSGLPRSAWSGATELRRWAHWQTTLEATLALSPFDNKAHEPGPSELRKVLGPSAQLWNQLISTIAKTHTPIKEVWNYGGPKYGWALRLKQKDRVVLYLIPQTKHFLVGVVLGEKAVKAVRECGVPASIMELIDNARVYAEGRGIRIPITTKQDIEAVQKLASAKMST